MNPRPSIEAASPNQTAPRGRRARTGWHAAVPGVMTALLATASAMLICACGGGDAESGADAADPSTGTALNVQVRSSIDDADWAPGETAERAAATPTKTSSPPTAASPDDLASNPLWHADGRARTTLPQDWPADPAAYWSGQRYATRAQLEHELTVAAPYSLVIDVDIDVSGDAAIALALQHAETAHAFGGGKQQLGVFVRSPHAALAAHVAERLSTEQGWAHVFVVI
jgi:hypothetical protein